LKAPRPKSYALIIRKEFNGEIVNDIFVKSFKRVHVSLTEFIGKKFVNADSLGKNILLFFDSLAIRVHLMMFGALHIYGVDEGLLKPEKLVRLLIKGDGKKLVVYNAPIVEADRADILLNRLKEELGPDPLSKDWNREEAFKRLKMFGNEKIGVVLLNQSVVAGIGNILRNEILFRAGINPERTVQSLSEEEIAELMEECETLTQQFLNLKVEKKRIKPLLQVYNNYMGTCKKCGGKIKFYMQQPINRKTFVCTNCQRI
jgi:endonuclease-8